jgi:hypothetical protein
MNTIGKKTANAMELNSIFQPPKSVLFCNMNLVDFGGFLVVFFE